MSKTARARDMVADVAQIIFGPWRMPAGFLLVSILIVFHITTVGRFSGNNPLIDSNPSGALASFLTALAFAGPVWLMNTFRERRGYPLTRTWYLATVLMSAAITAPVRIFLLSRYGFDLDFAPSIILQLTLRIAVLALVLLAIVGVYGAKLQAQIERAEGALALVQEQRSALFQAEERVRSSVSSFLHDRVQASLVAVGMQMRQLVNQSNNQTANQLGSLVEEIEKIRTDDVRVAARLLSPDIQTLGLVGALRELAQDYEPAVNIEVTHHLDGATDARLRVSESGLAIYHTAEQALLNSTVHGRASTVNISLDQSGQEVVLSVTDDGTGLHAQPITAGTGSLLMESATNAAGGRWSLQSRAAGGAIMRAHFPI